MSKKIEIHNEVNCENGVIAIFGRLYDELGFDEFIPPNARGLDIPSISYKGKDVVVEFEFKSSNFLIHGHQTEMENAKDYIVICWEDDCGLKNELQSRFRKSLYEVIELCKYVTIRERKNTENLQTDCYIMSYNSDYASNIEFGRWAEVNLFRTNFNEPKFPNGFPTNSKVLIYQKGLIIGGFTVVRCVKIKRPHNKETIALYADLVDKPITFWNHDEDDFSEDNFRDIQWHIFYTDFFDLGINKKKLDNYDIGKKIPNDGKLKINHQIYDKIRYS